MDDLDVPTVATTARLLMRPLTVHDAAEATGADGLLFESDEANRRWIEEWGVAHELQHGYGYWACRTRADRTLIGFCGWRAHDFGAALGYAVATPFRGLGFATEAATAAIGWGVAHVGVDLLFASIRPPNPASCRVLEKAGMVKVLEYDDQQGRRWIHTLPQRPRPRTSLSTGGRDLRWSTSTRRSGSRPSSKRFRTTSQS